MFSKNDDQLNVFSRPIKAVCLDPLFSKSKQYVTGDTSVSSPEDLSFLKIGSLFLSNSLFSMNEVYLDDINPLLYSILKVDLFIHFVGENH